MTDPSRDNNCFLLICLGAFHIDGGIPAVNRLVIRAVADAGYKLELFALNESDATVDERYISPEQIHYQVFRGNKYHFALAVWNALRNRTYKYVLADHVNLASILAIAKFVSNVQYCVWLHGIEVYSPRPTWEGRMGLKHACKLVANSEFTRENVSSRFPKIPVALCDLALDPIRHTTALPPDLHLPDMAPINLTAVNGQSRTLGKQMILHVGRMVVGERYKGQDSLLCAFPKIKDAFPKAQLVLAGHGNDRSRLVAMAKAMPDAIQSDIFLPGFVSENDLDRLYLGCYLYAMPSAGEGFGLVYLEAMSRAKPCLGGNVDATSCLVQEGVTGVLVDDPRSPDQVATALISLLSQPVQAAAMGQAGYELVRAHYLFEHFQERFWHAINPDHG